MKLKARASDRESLLLRLVGIGECTGSPEEAVLLEIARAYELADSAALGFVLPDPKAPEAETERLARLIARAVGLSTIKI